VARVHWLTGDEERAWRAYRRMRTLLDLQLARDSGLSEADYDVLSTLTEDGGPPWRATDLAARLLWSTSRLAHQVGRMERRGLVAREASEVDTRGALISLTDEGWRTLRAAARKHVRSVRANFIDLMEPAELEVLATIASKVVEEITPKVARTGPMRSAGGAAAHHEK
jgi:DNA-binding MarR family transcriptional regulator